MTADLIETWPGYREIPTHVNITREVLDRQLVSGSGDRTAFVFEGGSICYAELGRRVNRFAQALSGLNIVKGTKVLIRLPNCLEFVISFLALVKIGAVPVLQNSLLGPEEVAYVREHSDAKAAITLASIAEPLRALADALPCGIIEVRGTGKSELDFKQLIDNAFGEPFETIDTNANEPAFFVYTSGTTGRPKGIVHAHRWVIALGDTNKLRIPPLDDDVAMATGEWSFISALGHNVLFPMRNGITGAILEARATPENVLAAIEAFGVTLTYSVATVYRRILAKGGLETHYDLSSLRGCNATGEALEVATYEEWRRRIGCEIWEHYGLSEMQLIFGQGPRWQVRPGSIGKPLPGTRVEILDDDYQMVSANDIGHILIASDNPGFFLGYHKDPKKTAEVMHDGWYHTGDLGYADEDGYLWIAGRSDDCFKSRGIFISPLEIENALRLHDAVAEACVVPMADAEIGNRIRAVIVLRDGLPNDGILARKIGDDLKHRIAAYKVPHLIEFADSLPKSPVGKVLRRALME
ncbi:acyl-CoA synthetase [Alphaproteobacteria bacterium]|nr:acyl-CoA synthetase [Alphaproteobacteria bacterium]